MALWRGIGARKDATRGTSPIEVRKTVAALFARPGVLPGGANPLVTGDSTWAYNIGIANFVTSHGASDGDQLYGNDSVALIGATGIGSTVPIAPSAGLQRIDIAWTRHPTNLENADTSSEPLFGVESGTAASSNPVAPTIPAGALELGRNLMTSAATSTLSAGNTITQSSLYTALRGAPVPVRNQAERDAVPVFDGQRAYRLDIDIVETYNGTAWIRPPGSTMGTPTTTAATGTPSVSTAETRDAVLGDYTFTAVAGRRYRALVDGLVLSASVAGDQVSARVRNGGGSTPTAASTLVASSKIVLPAVGGVGQSSLSVASTFVPGAEVVTLSLFVVRLSGTGVETPIGARELYAVDLGPA